MRFRPLDRAIAGTDPTIFPRGPCATWAPWPFALARERATTWTWSGLSTERDESMSSRRGRIVTPDPPISDRGRRSKDLPLIEGGITISPGRAEGPLVRLETGAALETVPRGAVLLVDQPGPELAPLLPKLAALLAVEGHPVGHLATLAREFSVPSLFRVPSTERLDEGGVISVDATARRIHGGSRWPGMRDRVLARLASGKEVRRSGPLHDLILSLNLTDPDASSFKASRCRSLHDTIRFMHEMSVRSFFAFGDRQRKGWNKNTLRLDTALPVKFFLVHLDRAAFPKKKSLPPEEVNSLPFQAFWNGFSGKELHWPERWRRAMMGLPRDFQETVLGGDRGPRRTSDANFIMVGKRLLQPERSIRLSLLDDRRHRGRGNGA